MRPIKAKTIENRTSNNNKLKNTKKYLIEIWQLIFFSSLSIFLILTYLNQAWIPINFKQIEVTGLSGITKNDVKKITSIFFPKNLLELNPKEIEAHLIKKLPIKGISVSRKFFPPGIHLKFLEREPVAFASRISTNKVENGMIDREGYWIPLEFVNQTKKDNTHIFVENWNPTKKNDITLIINNSFKLQSQLQKIKLNSLQEITIETKKFKSVLLGSDTDRLIEQINKLNQLQKSLPNLLINTKVKTVDLKDPTKPELKVEKILNKEI